MVGTARRMEELSRSMALGRLRGLFGHFVRSIPPEHERGFEPVAEGKRKHSQEGHARARPRHARSDLAGLSDRSEEHTSELQSPCNLVCRLLLEKKKKTSSQKSPAYRWKN